MHTSFADTPQTMEVMVTVYDKCLVKMEKALNVWVEDVDRKCVLIDGNMLHQKALSLYENLNKESSETSDTRLFNASKG